MRRLALFVVGGVLALALAQACGDGDGNDDAAGTAGAGGGEGEGGNGNVPCDPEGDGVCQNETDCEAVESGEARTAAQVCGVSCLDDDDPQMCSLMCIADEVELTTACAACYLGAVACAAENCTTECASDPTSDECSECQIDAGCRSDFDECSGLDTGS